MTRVVLLVVGGFAVAWILVPTFHAKRADVTTKRSIPTMAPVQGQEGKSLHVDAPTEEERQNPAGTLAGRLDQAGFSIPGNWSPFSDYGPQESGTTWAPGFHLFDARRWVRRFKAIMLEVPENDAAGFGRYWPYCWNEGYYTDVLFTDKLVMQIQYSTPEWEDKFRSIVTQWAGQFGRPVEIRK